jgi:Flp pilus assembly protein protease CpaA
MMIAESLIVALVILIIGSITDMQKREVHDYVSYGLIFVAFGISLIYTVYYWNYYFIAQTIMGFIIGFAIAHVMFYLGQWGGGDSKLIMGLGAAVGFNVFKVFGEKNYWLLILLIAIIFVGAIYGLFWSIYLAFKHRKEFVKSMKEWSEKKHIRTIRRILLVSVVFFIAATLLFIRGETQILLITLIAIMYMMFYMWLFVKVIEESCMVKKISVSQVTEGDWVYQDVYALNKSHKKYIAGPKDLGISREQIALLKKFNIKQIVIKEGIPFIPAFLLAFIVILMVYHNHLTLGNFFMYFF